VKRARELGHVDQRSDDALAIHRMFVALTQEPRELGRLVLGPDRREREEKALFGRVAVDDEARFSRQRSFVGHDGEAACEGVHDLVGTSAAG
jgi:hypothetical protein